MHSCDSHSINCVHIELSMGPLIYILRVVIFQSVDSYMDGEEISSCYWYVTPHGGKFWLIALYLYTDHLCTMICFKLSLPYICCHVGSLISLWQSVQPTGRLAMVVAGGRIRPFMSSHVPLCTVTNKPPLVLRKLFQSCKLLFWCKYNCMMYCRSSVAVAISLYTENIDII